MLGSHQVINYPLGSPDVAGIDFHSRFGLLYLMAIPLHGSRPRVKKIFSSSKELGAIIAIRQQRLNLRVVQAKFRSISAGRCRRDCRKTPVLRVQVTAPAWRKRSMT